MGQIFYAILVGVVVFLVALLILPALTLPVSPWAAVLGVLAGLAVYFGTRSRL